MKQARDCGQRTSLYSATNSSLISDKYRFYSPKEGSVVVLLLLFIVTGPRTLGRGVNERGCGYIVSVSTARWHAQPAPKEAGASQDLYIFAHWQDSRVARLSLLSGRSYPFVHMHSDLKLIVKVLVAVVYSHEPGVDVHSARAATRNYCFTYKA